MSRCPNCMSELTDRKCSKCGYPLVELASIKEALPVGTILSNRYELGNALGKSYQSIAYIAYDEKRSESVILLEFFPKSVVGRNGSEVTIRTNRDLFVEACRGFLTSDQVQPLTMLDSFAQNNTVYRVYRLNKHSARAMEEAETLLDNPILFRNSDGKPLMSVNALAIPPLPKMRQWTMSKKIQSEKKHLSIRNMLVAVLVCAIVLLAGFFAYDAVRTHEVTIVVLTGSNISRATFGDIALTDGMTDSEKNEISFVVHVKKGKYALNVETEDGMQSDELVCSVKKPARFSVVVPDPIPEINVEPGQWLISDNGNYYIFDEYSGKPMNTEGKLAEGVSLADILVTFDQNGFHNGENLKFFIQRGNAKYNLPLSGDTAYAKVSAGEYALYLDDGMNEKQLATLNGETGYSVKINTEAIRCYLENLTKVDPAQGVFFIADQCSLDGVNLSRENLNAWAEEYPSLFGSFKQRMIHAEVSKDLAQDSKEYHINGIKWQPGDAVSLSANTDEWKLQVQIANSKMSYTETIPVSVDCDAITIGENIAKQIIKDEKWTKAKKLIIDGDSYALILEDGESIPEVKKTEFDEALSWFGERFNEQLSQKVTFSYEFDERVSTDAISIVTLDGVQLKTSETGGAVQVVVTPGLYELKISFKNGLEPVIHVIEIHENRHDMFLYEQANEAAKLNASLKEIGVSGVVQANEHASYLPEEANASAQTDAETYLKYREVYEKAFDKNEWKLAPVEIYIDEDIQRETIQAVSINGIELASDIYPYSINATAYDGYEVKVTFTDGQEVCEENLAVQENEMNQWLLLSDKAQEWMDSLGFWGEDQKQLRVFAGYYEYLTPESIEKAMEGYPVNYLSVICVEQYDWIKKFVVRSSVEGKNAELYPEIQVTSGVPMLCVYVPNGMYELWIVSQDDMEYLFIDEIEIKNNTSKDINVAAEGYKYPDPESTPCEHVFGDPIEEISATCTEKGKITRKCTICGKTQIEETEKFEHKIGVSVRTLEPTCEKPGEKERRCALCGETKILPIAALGHEFEWSETKAATCTEKGVETAKCVRCDEQATREINAPGHAYVEWSVTKAATCTEKGEETAKCIRCDEQATREINALDHRFGADGKCTACGYQPETTTDAGDGVSINDEEINS